MRRTCRQNATCQRQSLINLPRLLIAPPPKKNKQKTKKEANRQSIAPFRLVPAVVLASSFNIIRDPYIQERLYVCRMKETTAVRQHHFLLILLRERKHISPGRKIDIDTIRWAGCALQLTTLRQALWWRYIQGECNIVINSAIRARIQQQFVRSTALKWFQMKCSFECRRMCTAYPSTFASYFFLRAYTYSAVLSYYTMLYYVRSKVVQ